MPESKFYRQFLLLPVCLWIDFMEIPGNLELNLKTIILLNFIALDNFPRTLRGLCIFLTFVVVSTLIAD